MKSKVFMSVIILSGSVACGGSSYPEGYSEADKACFDYGAEACEIFQTYCDWQDGDPEYTSWYAWWELEENAALDPETTVVPQTQTCQSLDSSNEAYFSGAVDAGCDLVTFTEAWTSWTQWASEWNRDEEVWESRYCAY